MNQPTQSSLKKHKRHRWHRRLSSLLFYLILLIIALFSLFLWLTDTPEGFQALLHFAKPFLSSRYEIQITGPVQGVADRFQIDALKIHSLTVKNLSAQLQFRDLLLGKVNLVHLSGSLEPSDNFTIPLQLSGVMGLEAPYALNFRGHVNIQQKNSTSTLFKSSFQIAGTLSHYQFSAHGKGLILKQSSHLILQGFGSATALHTEELVLEFAKAQQDSLQKSFTPSIDGTLNISSFAPLQVQLDLSGQHLALQSHAIQTDPAYLDQLINFNLKLLTNANQQSVNLTLNSHLFSTQIQATREANSGKTQLNAVKINTTQGEWELPTTQLVLQSSLISLPHSCLTYQPKIQAKDNLAQNNQICGEIFFQNSTSEHPVDQDLISDIQIHLENLSLLTDIYHPMDIPSEMSGVLEGNMHIEGPLSDLKYTGLIQLKDARIGLPEWGIVLQKINLNLQSQNEPYIHILGSAQSGTGQLNWQGSAAYQNNRPIIVLTLKGQQVTLINLPLAHVIATPNLVYTQNEKIMALTGTIQIDSAQINADEYRNFPASESKDVVFVNNQNQIIQTQNTLPFDLNIAVMTDPHKNQIELSGFGIKTHISGQIMVNSVANKPTFAEGKLNLIQGDYQAYGKHFTITQGALIFNHSPLTNPNLDVSATYVLNAISIGGNTASSIVVGVKVTGTIQQIHLSLFSDPPMSQENILSYIITGQPLSQAGPGSQSALSQAALSFTGAGGDQSVMSKIQDTLKLNQLSVGSLNSLPSNNLAESRSSTSPDQDNTAVFVGKSITPRFSVSYGVGLFNSQQILLTHFKLSPHFYLQTDNSTLDAGADVFYTFEH